MKPVHIPLIMLAFLFISGCSSTPPAVNDPFGPKPAWVSQQPVDPNHYIGIASASKTRYGAEAQKSSQDLALANLAAQISVTISSEIVTTLIESGNMTREEYLATARSQAAADLEGHELVDSWQDANYHYTYYRLSKSSYAAIQARKREAAIALSADNLQKAQAAIAQNNFANAYQASIQAYLPLLPYLNEALKMKFRGEEVILSNTVHNQLSGLLSTIQLSAEPITLSAKLGQPVSEPIRIQARSAQGQALSGLPLTATFTKGAGELMEQVTTDNQGQAILKLTSITAPLKLQVLSVSVDRDQLLENQDSPILTGIIKSIMLPSVTITLDVGKPAIFLESQESFNGKPVSQAQVEPLVKNHFIQEGFEFVDSPSKADWQMHLRANANQGTEYSGMYTCFADVIMSVVDRSSGAEIYKNSVSRVKGIDLNYPNAANKALNNAAAELNGNIIPEILANLK